MSGLKGFHSLHGLMYLQKFPPYQILSHAQVRWSLILNLISSFEEIEVGSLLLRYEWITLQVLASWFRLKYPHIALGVWASSAPVLYYLGDTKDSPLKATDFGVSVFIEEGKVYRDIVGSAYYAAPEVLGRSYGKDIDVWSARVRLTSKRTLAFYIRLLLKDLVKKMLTWDPKKRINAAQALGDKHNAGWCYKFWETQLDRLATKDQTYQVHHQP
ncbi:hypothetical protein IFM89_007341 [Coptis chinensis]|uniref:Protein kinase domain-containing protein n=1 Tax=Coptis chinensis TaxID=261450 RepID=A0A835LBB0_9MAGN|nr:hypothetical protein IFM89_007341 [Coptis chinensis]